MMVKLLKSEVRLAKKIARRIDDRYFDYEDDMVGSISSLDAHIEACKVKYAAAKALEIKFNKKVLTREEWKVFQKRLARKPIFSTRHTKHPHGNLLLQEKDLDESIFIFIRIVSPTSFELVGWCYGKDGKKKKYWKEVGYNHPCYFVPAHALKPVGSLKRLLPKIGVTKTNQFLKASSVN